MNSSTASNLFMHLSLVNNWSEAHASIMHRVLLTERELIDRRTSVTIILPTNHWFVSVRFVGLKYNIVQVNERTNSFFPSFFALMDTFPLIRLSIVKTSRWRYLYWSVKIRPSLQSMDSISSWSSCLLYESTPINSDSWSRWMKADRYVNTPARDLLSFSKLSFADVYIGGIDEYNAVYTLE